MPLVVDATARDSGRGLRDGRGSRKAERPEGRETGRRPLVPDPDNAGEGKSPRRSSPSRSWTWHNAWVPLPRRFRCPRMLDCRKSPPPGWFRRRVRRHHCPGRRRAGRPSSCTCRIAKAAALEVPPFSVAAAGGSGRRGSRLSVYATPPTPAPSDPPRSASCTRRYGRRRGRGGAGLQRVQEGGGPAVDVVEAYSLA
jgi:hypothetical protein